MGNLKKRNKINIKLIFIAFFVLFVFNVNTLHSVSFKEVNYIKAIKSHPLLKQYDPITGRFKNTKSEIISLDELKKDINKLNIEKKELIEKRNALANDSVLIILGEDSSVWKDIKQYDERILKINELIKEKQNLISTDGIPHFTVVIPQIESIVKETISSLTANVDDETIVLNSFPMFYCDFKEVRFNNKYSGYEAFMKTKEKKYLVNYIKENYNISFLFPLVKRSVLYKKGSKNE